MKHIISYPCKKCHLPITYLLTVRHLVKSKPATFKFYVECACKQDKMYDTAEEAIQVFNKANASAKKKTYRQPTF
jgi:RNase P subunit RPR2